MTATPRLTRAKPVHLNPKQQYELINLVKAQYETMKATDIAFAAHATTELGTEVKACHVATARNVVGIAGRSPGRPADPEVKELRERLDLVEATVEELERKVAALQASVRKVAQ